jgi:hypothetical protein
MSSPKSVEAISARRTEVRKLVMAGVAVSEIAARLGKTRTMIHSDVVALQGSGLVRPPRAVKPEQRAARLFYHGIRRGSVDEVLTALTDDEYKIMALLAAQHGTVAGVLLHAVREAIKAELPLRRKSR